MPIIEKVREATMAAVTDPDAPLDFVPAGLALGLTQDAAEHIDELLTVRIMRSRGAL